MGLAQTGSADFFAGLQYILRPEFSKYLFLIAGLFGVLIAAIIITAVVRRAQGAPRRSLSAQTMPFHNLDKMKKSGTLTAEEISKIRQAMAKRMLAPREEEEVTVDDLEVELARKSWLNETGATQEAPPQMAAKVSEDQPDAPGTANLLDMAAAGKISKEEFERLREIFEAQDKERR